MSFFAWLFFSDTSAHWEFTPCLGVVWLFSRHLYGAERSVSALCHSHCRVGHFLQGKCIGLEKSLFKLWWSYQDPGMASSDFHPSPERQGRGRVPCGIPFAIPDLSAASMLSSSGQLPGCCNALLSWAQLSYKHLFKRVRCTSHWRCLLVPCTRRNIFCCFNDFLFSL